MENEMQENLVNKEGEAPVISVKDWLITLVIAAIPIVGLIFLFLWGFGSDSNPNKANWAKGALLFYAIIIALYVIFFVLIFGSLAFLGSMDG